MDEEVEIAKEWLPISSVAGYCKVGTAEASHRYGKQ